MYLKRWAATAAGQNVFPGTSGRGHSRKPVLIRILFVSLSLLCAAPASAFSVGEIRVRDETGMSPTQRSRVEAEFRRWAPRVYAYLGVVDPLPLNLVFTRRIGIGYYARPNLYVPPADELEMLETWVHELAHHATGHQSNFFFKEGIATHTLEALFQREDRVPLGFPQYGQSTDAWVALFLSRGLLRPLAELMAQQRYDGSSADADFRSWQVYLIAASFVGWLIRNEGLGVFRRAFDTEDLGTKTRAWQAQWLAELRQQQPVQFDPAKHLPDRPRYQHWVSRLSLRR